MNILYIILIIIIIIFIIQIYCKKKNKSLLENIHPTWYVDINKFPYDDFKCKKECNKYNIMIKDGYEKMKNTTIVFCGLCINIENKITDLKNRFEYLGSFFKYYRVIIFENNSIDNTRNLLKNLTMNNNKFILLECEDARNCIYATSAAKDYGVFSNIRMYKMVQYRNRLLSYIRNYYVSFDTICMVDLDINGPISIDGIAHSFGNYDRWDSITAYGINGITITAGQQFYYDLIAYKDDYYDVNTNRLDLIPIYLKNNFKVIGDDLYKVRSAFGGLELIKSYVINDNNNINYTPIDDNYICEHIIFHENMIRNKYDRIYINPNMVILVGLQGNEKKLYVY